jgi:hypothetical protein
VTFITKGFSVITRGGSFTASQNTLIKAGASSIIALPSTGLLADSRVGVIGAGDTQVTGIDGAATTYISDGEEAWFYINPSTSQWSIAARDATAYSMCKVLTYTTFNASNYGLFMYVSNCALEYLGVRGVTAAAPAYYFSIGNIIGTSLRGIISSATGVVSASTLFNSRLNAVTNFDTQSALHWLGWVSGLITGFTNLGGGNVSVTCTPQYSAWALGLSVSIVNTTNYDGTYAITNPLSGSFTIAKVYVAETPSSFSRAISGQATLTAGAVEVVAMCRRLSKNM